RLRRRRPRHPPPDAPPDGRIRAAPARITADARPLGERAPKRVSAPSAGSASLGASAREEFPCWAERRPPPWEASAGKRFRAGLSGARPPGERAPGRVSVLG